jgi:hypothetical protein
LFDPSDALNGLSRCHFEDQGGREKTVAQPTESRIRCNSRAFLDNLVLLCGHHHRVVHNNPWQVSLGPDRRPVFSAPDRGRFPLRVAAGHRQRGSPRGE